MAVTSTMNININVGATSAMRQVQRFRKEINHLSKAVGTAAVANRAMNASMRSGMQNLARYSKDLQWVGRQIEFNFTLPLVLGGAAVTKWALDNERAMVRVRKVYNDATDNMLSAREETDLLNRSFRLLSDQFGVHQNEVADIGAMWAQAGANGRALAEATKTTLQVMILGEFEAVEATEALIAVQSQFALGAEELTLVMAQLNAIENETAVNFQGLVEAMSRGAGAARAAGVDWREFAAMTAALVPAAGSASEAGNALRTMISRVMAPTGEAKEAMRGLGLEIDSTAWGSKTFVERLHDISNAMENVTTSQQNQIAATIASRWQVNRFNVLLNDLRDENGRYAKALEVTASEQDVMNRYYKELEIYLKSTPQGFKILTTQMRNLLTEAIQPLLPLMLDFLRGLRDMVKWFTELPPHIQKAAGYAALLLVVIGPIMRIVGAFGLAAWSLASAFKALAPAMKVAGTVAAFIFSPLKKVVGSVMLVVNAFGTGGRMIQRSLGLMLSSLAVLPLKMGRGIAQLGAFVVGALYTKFLAPVVATMATTGKVIAVRFLQNVITPLWVAGRRGIVMMAARLHAYLGAGLIMPFRWAIAKTVAVVAPLMSGMFGLIFRGGIGAALGPWLALFAAIAGAVYVFRDRVREALEWIGRNWNQLPTIVGRGLINLVNVIKKAAMAAYEWMSYLNPFQRHSPSLVEQVQAGVDLIARKYAELSDIGRVFSRSIAAFKAFGVAVQAAKQAMRGAEFSELRSEVLSKAPGAGGPFDMMVKSIYELEDALARVRDKYADQWFVVQKWAAELATANAELEVQEGILTDLRDAASTLRTELDNSLGRLNDLTQTPIEGMRAMSDAIFENEMAQKRLRLEILRMEDAQGTVEDLRDRMAALSGDIEMLRGRREDLRLAGAGSDVLAVYDQQISAIEAEREALMRASAEGGGQSEIERLRAELANLQREGEILDLEESLKFDPLLRQIEQVTEGMEEMPFDELIKLIKEEQKNVVELTAAWEAADDAANAQQVIVDGLTERRDLIQEIHDTEMQNLRELGDAYDGILGQIADMEQALRGFASAASGGSGGGGLSGGPLGVGGDFAIPGGAGADLTGGDIEAFNNEIMKELENIFPKIDLMEPLKRKWEEFQNWFKTKWTDFRTWISDNVNFSVITDNITSIRDTIVESDLFQRIKEVGENIGGMVETGATLFGSLRDEARDALDLVSGFFRDAGTKIFGELKNWGPALRGIWDSITLIFQVAFAAIAGIFATGIGVITALWPLIKHTLKPVLDGVAELIRNIIQIIRGVIEIIAGIITGDWKLVWEGLSTVVDGVFDGLFNIVRTGVGTLFGIIRGIAEGIGRIIRGVVNLIADGINALIEGWNGLSFKLPSFDGLYGTVMGKRITIIPSWEGPTIGTPDLKWRAPKMGSSSGDWQEQQRAHREAKMMAGGGLVTSPTLAILGETIRARPEIVTPERLMRRIVNEEASMMAGNGNGRTIVINGDLSFPNMNRGDAEEFLRNLEAMVN